METKPLEGLVQPQLWRPELSSSLLIAGTITTISTVAILLKVSRMDGFRMVSERRPENPARVCGICGWKHRIFLIFFAYFLVSRQESRV